MSIVEKTFRNWFKIMWQNRYIQLFTIALILAILELCNLNLGISLIYSLYGDLFGQIMTILGFSIPWLMMIIIGYFGFYKFWKGLTK